MAKKPSKLKQIYQNLRKQLSSQRSRITKKYGMDSYELPFSLKDLGIRNPKASDYRSAIKEMKAFKEMMTEEEERYKEQQEQIAQYAISDFLYGLDEPQFYGGRIIVRETWHLVDNYGAVKVASVLQNLQDSGYVIDRPELYNADYAIMYVGYMTRELVNMGVMTEEQAKSFQSAIEPKSEYVDMELQ